MRAFIERLAGPRSERERTFIRPDDQRGQHPEKGGGQHAGLLLQRYLSEYATGEGGNPEEKRAILQAAIHAAGNGDVQALYRGAFARWKASVHGRSSTIELTTQGRLIVGLGSENVLETGISLHHTYGLPIIPGSALKGLAAHYCNQVWGPTDKKFQKTSESENEAYRKFLAGNGLRPEDNFHRLIFGSSDDGGCIIFHDAWFVPGSEKEPLKLDVMTPHHSGWNTVKNPVPPTDFDSPIPVPFLSVTGKFLVAVSWHGPEHIQSAKWTDLVMSLLRDALFEWGVGGKTTSGYGRLAVPACKPASPLPQKRSYGIKAKVQIISLRLKGGFNVQDVEPGHKPGTLTLGTPPPATETNLGSIVDVLVHNDERKCPQYKWP